jgi:IMP dehydrogenase/GMP reductase
MPVGFGVGVGVGVGVTVGVGVGVGVDSAVMTMVSSATPELATVLPFLE